MAPHRKVPGSAIARNLLLVVLAMLAAVPAGATAARAASSTPAPLAHVRYQYGIETYFTYSCQDDATIEQWAQTQAASFRSLGANSISIMFPIYTDSLTSNNIYAESVCGTSFQTPPPSALALVVAADQAAGLRVTLRPTLDQTILVKENWLSWKGSIAPSSVSTWLLNYLTTLTPYLKMAQKMHVGRFALESELDSMTTSGKWIGVEEAAHHLYQGDLLWNYSWHAIQPKHRLRGTTFSIDAYPSLGHTSPKATLKQLLAKWDWLPRQSGFKVPSYKGTTMDEVGIPAQVFAYAAPNFAEPLAVSGFDQTVQANWYRTACTFVKKHHMSGIYFLGPWLDQSQGTLLSAPDPNDLFNIQPAAQRAIRSCFG